MSGLPKRLLGYYLCREVDPPSLKTNRGVLRQSGRICKERAPHPASQAPRGVRPSGCLQKGVAGVAVLTRICPAAGSWAGRAAAAVPLGLPPPCPAYSEWVTQPWESPQDGHDQGAGGSPRLASPAIRAAFLPTVQEWGCILSPSPGQQSWDLPLHSLKPHVDGLAAVSILPPETVQ